MNRAAAVTVAVAVATAAGATTASGGQRDANATSRASIASVTTTDFRAVLTAVKDGSSGSPTATVTLSTWRRAAGRWRRTGLHRLSGPYFWNTVTGPRSVCRLEIRAAGRQPAFRPVVTAQLLITPSIGCGRVHRYSLVEP